MTDSLKDRKKEDRRKIDLGTYNGWQDRRRNPDRRLAQVSETTFEEWVTWVVRQKARSQASKPASRDTSEPLPENQRLGQERREEDTSSPTGWHERRQHDERRTEPPVNARSIAFQALQVEK